MPNQYNDFQSIIVKFLILFRLYFKKARKEHPSYQLSIKNIYIRVIINITIYYTLYINIILF